MGNCIASPSINGRRYDYWQRTYRLGTSVKTENKYIGPSGSAAISAFAASSNGTTTAIRPGDDRSIPFAKEISPTAPSHPKKHSTNSSPSPSFSTEETNATTKENGQSNAVKTSVFDTVRRKPAKSA
jgi:hypothetical protein